MAANGNNNHAAEKARLIESAQIWLEMRDRLHDHEPDDPQYDDAARDLSEAECALSLAIRLLHRAQKGTNK